MTPVMLPVGLEIEPESPVAFGSFNHATTGILPRVASANKPEMMDPYV
jgi:hypothetical protein